MATTAATPTEAVIEAVTRNEDGTATVRLRLLPAGGGLGRVPPPARAAAPPHRMVVLNPPLSFEAAAGTQVRIDGESVWVGGTRWAERVGYSRLRLLAVRKG